MSNRDFASRWPLICGTRNLQRTASNLQSNLQFGFDWDAFDGMCSCFTTRPGEVYGWRDCIHPAYDTPDGPVYFKVPCPAESFNMLYIDSLVRVLRVGSSERAITGSSRERLAAPSAAVIYLELLLGCLLWAGVICADTPPAVNDTVPRTRVDYVTVQSYEDLKKLAQQVSLELYVEQPELPDPLRDWQYDDYINVRYRPQRATWWNQGLPFWLETFHRGFVQTDRVELFTLNPMARPRSLAFAPGPSSGSSDGTSDRRNVTQRIAFSKDDFEYQPPLRATDIPSAGHAGVRIVGTFPGRPDGQEMLTFVGSSYFRARSGDTLYGSSARGLAIDIGMNRDEEFPDFRAFWIERPEPQSRSLTVLAHLDSPSVSGAYRFRFTPGEARSVTDVEATLYFRRVPDKTAWAPLTSMWMWGDGLAGPPEDLRPGVHDADGLLIHVSKDDWRWRAFARQAYPSVTSTSLAQLQGFGVIQRHRAFFHYDDHNARYHERPSVWVTPDEPWRNGRVELLELPGAHEGIDNIAAYWVPDEPPRPGEPLELEYSVSLFAGEPPHHVRLARATDLQVERSESSIRLTIRFSGAALRTLTTDDPPTIAGDILHGRFQSQRARRTDTGDWIVTADVVPDGQASPELSLQLRHQQKPVSESFGYLLPPKEPQFMYPQVYTRRE